jgi:hypothetical protein
VATVSGFAVGEKTPYLRNMLFGRSLTNFSKFQFTELNYFFLFLIQMHFPSTSIFIF